MNLRYFVSLFAVLVSATPTVSFAQSGMSYEAAQLAMSAHDPGAEAAALEVEAAEDQAEALSTLYRPTVIASASVIAYEKTLSVDLSDTKQRILDETGQFLDTLPDQFPPAFTSIVSLVSGRIEEAIPGLLAPLPDELRYRAKDVVVRPSLTALMPIYTGGALEAVQDGAAAGVLIARGGQRTLASANHVQLAQRYFGLQLARSLVVSAQNRRDANERHLANARAMESEGILPRSTTLEVTVLRDAAQRGLERAMREERLARLSLARLTGREVEAVATPLFVNRRPLPPLAEFSQAAGINGNGQADLAQGKVQIAEAGERLARASMRPRAYAFGSYTVDTQSNVPTEPDWLVGGTVSLTLISPVQRRRLVAAASARREAARAQQRAAQDRIASEIERTHALTESARTIFLSMESSLAAARENLRVQEIAFREGVGTASRLLDAQALLATAETQRASAAYEYDLSLAALLAASGIPEAFTDYTRRDDRMFIDDQ
ncbi:TolC family protein [Parasphingorhabdus sp.]|uniref:TolC family protein n=1 Tax=Parasphingorhabdus sp. TaxID=2709688 RepID=UPI003A8EF87E